MSGEYKIGDLVLLNDFGRLVFQTNEQCVGLVVAGPFQLVYSFTFPIDSDDEEYEFWSYDVMIGDELITTVPEEFIDELLLFPDYLEDK